MSDDTLPNSWRHPDSRKTARKPQEPLVNDMPEIIHVCACGRFWASLTVKLWHITVDHEGVEPTAEETPHAS